MPTLEAEGRKQVYDPNRTTQEELKRLNKSILHKFLELLDFLVNDPEHAQSKVDELELLFVNFHYLLNGYRTHQARQTLISWLEEQLERRSKALDNIRQLLSQARNTVGESAELLNRYQQEIRNAIMTTINNDNDVLVVKDDVMMMNETKENEQQKNTTNDGVGSETNEINCFSMLVKLQELRKEKK